MNTWDNFLNGFIMVHNTSEVRDFLISQGLKPYCLATPTWSNLCICTDKNYFQGTSVNTDKVFLTGHDFLRKVKSEMFSKEDLVAGKHIVEFNNGKRMLFIGDCFISSTAHILIDSITSDFVCEHNDQYSVKRVYYSSKTDLDRMLKHPGCLLWEREDNSKTLKKIEELKATIAEASKQIKELEEEL